MSIISITIDEAGQVGQSPRRNKMVCTDSLATITAAGFINSIFAPAPVLPSDIWDVTYLFNQSTNLGTYGEFLTTISGGVITLSLAEGSVILPVVSGDFANFSGTSGAISDAGFSPTDPTKTKVAMLASSVHNAGGIAHFSSGADGTIDGGAANVFNLGNISAGFGGTPGILTSVSPTNNHGTLNLTAADSAGNTATVITNASMGAARTYTLPDTNTPTANFIMSESGSSQVINSGSVAIVNGNLNVGGAGATRSFVLVPTTAARGSLVFQATNNTGNTTTTISNAAYGQATALTIPDPASSTANFSLNTGAISVGTVATFNTNTGTIGYNSSKFTAQIGTYAGGSATFSFAASSVTAGIPVSVTFATQANAASVLTATAGAGVINVVASANPGASTLNYIACIAQ
jgi:hypothetical protein